MNAENEGIIKEESACFILSNCGHGVIINWMGKTQVKEEKEVEERGGLSQAQVWTGNMEQTAAWCTGHMRAQRRNTYFWVKESKFQLDSCLHESHPKQNSLFILDFIKCHLFRSTSLPGQSDFRISFKVFCIKASYVFSFPEFLQNQPSLCRLSIHNPELDLNLLCQYVFS